MILVFRRHVVALLKQREDLEHPYTRIFSVNLNQLFRYLKEVSHHVEQQQYALILLPTPAALVPHGSEIAYVFGGTTDSSLSNIMMDYWLSFASSLTPNDGRGTERMSPIYADLSKVSQQHFAESRDSMATVHTRETGTNTGNSVILPTESEPPIY